MSNESSNTNHISSSRVLPAVRFDPEAFAREQFLWQFQGDVESLVWCIKDALNKHTDTRCEPRELVFGDVMDNAPSVRSAWANIEFEVADREPAIVVVGSGSF